MGFFYFTLIMLVIATTAGFLIVRKVPQGMLYTVESFGKHVRTLEPGFNTIKPFFESVGEKVLMMEQVLDLPPQEVITKDNAHVMVDGVAFYKILDPIKASYDVEKLSYALTQLITTSMRTVIGSMDLDKALSERIMINNDLLESIKDEAGRWGVKVERIQVKNITPPRDLVAAMALQLKAEREKRASVLDAESTRDTTVLIAEGEKKASILTSEAGLEVARNKANEEKVLAEGKSNKIRLIAEAMEVKNGRMAVEYFMAQENVGAAAKLAASINSKLIIFPAELSNLTKTLGTLGESFIEDGTETKIVRK